MANTSQLHDVSAWMQNPDETEPRAVSEEATVESYSESDPATGLVAAAMDTLPFPFRTRASSEPVMVVDAQWSEHCEVGLDLMADRNGQRHRVEAQSVELLKPPADGHPALAA